MRTKIVPVRLDEQTKRELQTYADSVNRKLSDFIRCAAKYVRDNKIKV